MPAAAVTTDPVYCPGVSEQIGILVRYKVCGLSGLKRFQRTLSPGNTGSGRIEHADDRAPAPGPVYYYQAPGSPPRRLDTARNEPRMDTDYTQKIEKKNMITNGTNVTNKTGRKLPDCSDFHR